MTHDDDFYEEDEPVEEVLAAFERGEKVLTAGSVLMVDNTGSVVIRDIRIVQMNRDSYLRARGPVT